MNKQRKIFECRYCKTTENLRQTTTKDGRVFIYAVCLKPECIEKYKADKLEKRKKTNLEKYGVENVAQLEESKQKVIQTSLSRYGTEHASWTKEACEKRIATNLEKYGVENPNQNREVREKLEQTNLERYGHKNARCNEEVRAKAENTNIEKYGVANVFNSKEIQEKIKHNTFVKYGVEHVSHSPEIRQKQIEGIRKKYGTDSIWSSPLIREKVRKTQRKNAWRPMIRNLSARGITPQFTETDLIDSGYNNKTYVCTHCNSTFVSDNYWKEVSCECQKRRSNYEDEIITWLKTVGVANIAANHKFTKEHNNTTKYEIDIFIPDFNFGIDFHGLYWHSTDIQPSTSYCRDKYLYFKDKGIQLIQVFENEWLYKSELVKSIIKNKLKMNSTVAARKCTVRKIDYQEAANFLQHNHLQGPIKGTLYLGLYDSNDQLVCLAVFGQNRYSTDAGYELYRFCNKLNIAVIGGMNKLLKYFEQEMQPTMLSSFVDVRYFSGAGYSKSGFTFVNHTDPNYFYFKLKETPIILHSRVAFQKHKLANKLPNFDPALSEVANMRNNDYLRIFDAGNLKFVKKYV